MYRYAHRLWWFNLKFFKIHYYCLPYTSIKKKLYITVLLCISLHTHIYILRSNILLCIYLLNLKCMERVRAPVIFVQFIHSIHNMMGNPKKQHGVQYAFRLFYVSLKISRRFFILIVSAYRIWCIYYNNTISYITPTQFYTQNAIRPVTPLYECRPKIISDLSVVTLKQ